jgi:transmembrane sensor
MSVDDEAALWLARLQSSDATEEDHADCAAWRARDSAHDAAFMEFQALWDTLSGAPVRRPTSRRRRAAAVGSLLLMAGIVLAAAPEAVLRLRADAIAPTGTVVHMTLPDGSQLDLDSGAAVAFDFDDSVRQVRILRGAVFVDVTPDPSRPFTLEANTLVARAVGTRYGASATSVIVSEGTVEARTPAGAVTLHAGEAARITDGHLERGAADPTSSAWREGRLVVSHEPLAQVLNHLGRYRRGRILLLDREAAARPVSGVFDITDSEAALDLLAQGLGLRVTRLPGLTLLR